MMTGNDLIALGHKPGKWFGPALKEANLALNYGASPATVNDIIAKHVPPLVVTIPMRDDGLPYFSNVHAETTEEGDNLVSVDAHMRELMRVPTVVAGAIMPDACAAGTAPGTIPVGGVIAAKDAIHPGMHSSDICCSVACTVFDNNEDETFILDTAQRLTHFGGGGRGAHNILHPSRSVMQKFADNSFLHSFIPAASNHFGTQGDGNHFLYLGRLKSTGQLALVTHHGSRLPGALLYKAGMAAAQKHTAIVSPDTPKHNAWIKADSATGESYWQALQAIRAWTKENHFVLHGLIAHACKLHVAEQFWNEHNFVFRKSDGLFYHGKGATPAWQGFAADSNGLTLIPLNMAAPILIAKGLDNPNALGFAPHGAGRNYSRTAHMKKVAGRLVTEVMEDEVSHIDARFYSGNPDVSELPSAYKDHKTVTEQIAHYGLAEIVDEINPIGCIMAGDWQRKKNA